MHGGEKKIIIRKDLSVLKSLQRKSFYKSTLKFIGSKTEYGFVELTNNICLK